ncbi:MAG: aminopeptidase P family protein [Candidatus Anammoximicrobium sp.]|nr:aminopeptidase P family protein [Candidatus Anammoximicrobium sp.]
MSSSVPLASADARVWAGVPAINCAFYWRVRFSVGDPAALIELPVGKRLEAIFILRDIEMERARRDARVDRVCCPADFAPAGGLSGDRETATAQAVAECLRRSGVRRAIADRTLPLLFAHEIQKAGIAVDCDPDWGVVQRRSKDEQEIQWLQESQQATEAAMQMACETVCRAKARADGVLMVDGQPLTSERLRAAVDVFLLQRGYTNPTSIIAGGPQGADCHDSGAGELRTEQPVIIDIFPRNRKTLYYGDCTRTAVHGQVSDELRRMHRAVVAAKAAAAAACRAGVTGEAVNEATQAAITAHGYSVGLPPADAPDTYCAITHGTGHGIGLDVHEPPLLDKGGPELVVGDAVTIEPGLYCKAVGGIRVEDLVIVTREGCRNLNRLPEGLQWP